MATFDPQASTAAMNAAGYMDTPAGRAQQAAGIPPSGAGMATNTTAQLGSAIDQYTGAMSSGDLEAFQEQIRQFNLNYANSVAQLYGQNYGPGNPAPIGAATLPAGQAVGSIGYIPGFTGSDASQTQSNLAQQASTAQSAAGLTGFYAAPAQSQYTPGTFVRLDPGTYDTQQYGQTQISYVLPSGQLQRVSIPQAQAMGWNGNVAGMNTISAPNALRLEAAPPSTPPQQTLAGQTTYSNLNTAAVNQALQQSQATGMYQAPAAIVPPGTDLQGNTFSSLPAATQQAYFQAHGGDWQSAMNAWVSDSNSAIQKWAQQNNIPVPGGPGQSQETQQAQLQYANEANQLAQMYGSYYTPLAPGQTGQAGVNMPNQGQTTLAAQQQAYAQQMGVINSAASLQANPFRQAQVLGQAGALLQGNPVPGFAAPNTVAGVGTQGGNTQGGMGYMQQMIDDIRNPVANQTAANSILDATPTPNKLDSNSFFKSAPGTQNLVLQAMQEKYGIDPNDSLQQIKNTLPQFSAPSTFGQVKS